MAGRGIELLAEFEMIARLEEGEKHGRHPGTSDSPWQVASGMASGLSRPHKAATAQVAVRGSSAWRSPERRSATTIHTAVAVISTAATLWTQLSSSKPMTANSGPDKA